MKIDTGYRTLTTSSSKTSLVLYKCHECGKYVLKEQKVSGYAHGTYHEIQSMAKRESISRSAREIAAQELVAADEKMYEDVNVKKNFHALDTTICPYCYTKQIWSYYGPCKWVKSVGFIPWLLVLLVALFFAVCGCLYEMPYLVIIPLLWGTLPLFRRKKRKQYDEYAKGIHYSDPIYYNQKNMDKLIQGKHKDLLLEYLKNKQKR